MIINFFLQQNIPSNMVTMAEVPPGAEEKNRFKDVLPSKKSHSTTQYS